MADLLQRLLLRLLDTRPVEALSEWAFAEEASGSSDAHRASCDREVPRG